MEGGERKRGKLEGKGGEEARESKESVKEERRGGGRKVGQEGEERKV